MQHLQDTFHRLLDPGTRPWTPPVDILETAGQLRLSPDGARYGSFARTFTSPNTVDVEGVKAEHKSGVLVVTLPKKDVAKPRTIKVEINNN